MPEDGYQGDYVAELVDPRARARELDLDELGREGSSACLADDRDHARALRRAASTCGSPSARSTRASPARRRRARWPRSRRQGEPYRHEGALWLRTSAHGDDKDRVLERSSGEHTYFASDVAYHQDKLARGLRPADRRVGRRPSRLHRRGLQAAFEALGGDPRRLELIILQFVHLVEGGGRASMSKRRGEYVTLDELIDEIGADAARYFLLARSHDTTVDLDLDLAREQSNENPVYYIQYAHARIASVLAKAGAERVQRALEADWRRGSGTAAPLEPAERSLIKKVLALPEEVAEAAERRAPHRIATYALELAQEFTAFYRDCRIVGAEPRAVESFRLALAVAAQRTIARGAGPARRQRAAGDVARDAGPMRPRGRGARAAHASDSSKRARSASRRARSAGAQGRPGGARAARRGRAAASAGAAPPAASTATTTPASGTR